MAFKRKVKIEGKNKTVTDRIDQIVIGFGENKETTLVRCRTAAYQNEKAMLEGKGFIDGLHVTTKTVKNNDDIPSEIMQAIELIKAYCYTNGQLLAGAEEFEGATPII